MASAQADFRANDRDGNGVNEFWREDIAGLYALVHRAEGSPNPRPIQLIELSIAAADAQPITAVDPYATRSTKAGYWYRTLRFEDEDPKKLDPQRFAAAAFPDSRNTGMLTYIISHENVLYCKDLGSSRGLAVFPSDPVQAGWTRLD